MTNEITTKDLSETAFDIDLHSLTNGTTKQSDSISNSNDYPAAFVGIQIKTGVVAPDLGSVFVVYLFRRMTNMQDDNAGATKTTITPQNMLVLGNIKVTAATATTYERIFTTEHLGPLGPEWGIAVKNSTGQTTDSTSGNHAAYYRYYVPELQEP
jgi:hypothetical protein